MFFNVHSNNTKASLPLAQPQPRYTKSIKKDCMDCWTLQK